MGKMASGCSCARDPALTLPQPPTANGSPPVSRDSLRPRLLLGQPGMLELGLLYPKAHHCLLPEIRVNKFLEETRPTYTAPPTSETVSRAPAETKNAPKADWSHWDFWEM